MRCAIVSCSVVLSFSCGSVGLVCGRHAARALSPTVALIRSRHRERQREVNCWYRVQLAETCACRTYAFRLPAHDAETG